MPSARRWAVALGVAWCVAGCGGSSRPSGPEDPCDPSSGIGLGSSCNLSCRSWSHAVLVGACHFLDDPGSTPCPGYATLVPDRSGSPATAEVKVGELVEVDVVARDLSPPSCNQGFFNGATVWTSSDPSVLQLQPEASLDHKKAVFRALAPGTAQLAAENLPTPAGQTVHVDLTACGQAVAPNAPPCPTPGLPLVLEVVP